MSFDCTERPLAVANATAAKVRVLFEIIVFVVVVLFELINDKKIFFIKHLIRIT